MARSRLAEELRRQHEIEVAALTPGERVILALEIGDDAVALRAAATHVSRTVARRELRREGSARRPRPTRGEPPS